MLCGLLTPTSGRASRERLRRGHPARGDPAQHRLHVAEVLALRRSDGGREHRFLHAASTACRASGARSARTTCCGWPTSTERREALTRTLSGGWKQRLALGCAILHDPPVLFLDEPTSGVDPIARGAFWELIHDLSETGHTIFVSTHYMDEAEYCHRLALMYRGKVIALGTPAELKDGLTAHSLLQLDTSDPLGTMRALGGPGRRARRGGVRRRPARDGGRCGGRQRAHPRRRWRRRASRSGAWSRSSLRWKTCSWP